MGKMFIGTLALVAEFESDLIRARTRDAIDAAAAAGKVKGRRHKLTPEERAYLLQIYETRQFKVETLCKKTGLKQSALYSNIELARKEREAGMPPGTLKPAGSLTVTSTLDGCHHLLCAK